MTTLEAILMADSKSAVIVGFADKKTETLHRGGRVAAFSGFTRTASRKRDPLDAA